MEVKIHGRSVTITDRFENYVAAKIEKISTLLPKALLFEARVSRTSDKSPVYGDHVELTVTGVGPVIRAEATATDKFSAFDIAYGRLLERIRRHKDKRRADHKRGKPSLGTVAAHGFDTLDVTPADVELLTGATASDAADAAVNPEAESDYTPVVIRHKSFPAEVMSADAAVDRMELVGHDFFLFIDEANNQPSVVYRRKGWNYGVISLTKEA